MAFASGVNHASSNRISARRKKLKQQFMKDISYPGHHRLLYSKKLWRMVARSSTSKFVELYTAFLFSGHVAHHAPTLHPVALEM